MSKDCVTNKSAIQALGLASSRGNVSTVKYLIEKCRIKPDNLNDDFRMARLIYSSVTNIK